MYHTEGGGSRFRLYNSCNLAWWHSSYKYGCLKIWKAYASTILAPFLYPGGQFHEKPGSFPNVVFHLLVLARTWPHIKDKVAQLRSNGEIRGARKQLLDEIVFLFEFAIPTVCTHIVNCTRHIQTKLIILSVVCQVIDYGLCLKLEDGWLAVQKLMKLVQMLMMLSRGKSSRYVQSMLAQILIVLDQRERNTPAWQMLRTNLSVFNEEAGEITFSILARCVLGDTSKNQVEQLSKVYSLLHAYTETERQLGEMVSPGKLRKAGRKRLKEDNEVLAASKVFMKQWVRKLGAGTLRMYGDKTASFKNSANALTRMKILEQHGVGVWDVNLQTCLNVQLVKAKAKFNSNWAQDYSDIWPECKPKELPGYVIEVEWDAADNTSDEEPGEEEIVEGEEDAHEVMQEAEPVKAKRKRARPPKKFSCDSSNSDSADSDASQLSTRGVRARRNSADLCEEESTVSSKASSKIGALWSKIDPSNVRNKRPGQRKNRGRREQASDSFPMVSKF